MASNDSRRNHEDPARQSACPECGQLNLETIWETETFDGGGRKKPIRVTASLPIKRCPDCHFAFEDSETEAARHAAACARRGVQSPAEIRAIRESHGLSQR